MIEQVCQGINVSSALNNPEYWVLRYIKTYFEYLDVVFEARHRF